MNLNKRRVLITAGPTWVAIDTVRVISNIATGKTGILLAEKLQKLGAQVTLLLGAAETRLNHRPSRRKAGIKLIPFRFFDELKRIIIKELTSRKYDIVIHSAAVSDYRPLKTYPGKVRSGLKNWRLNLVPTIKIIDAIKKMDKSLFLVGFKFEPQASKKTLVDKTRGLISQAKLDLAVANTININRYQAYIVSKDKTHGPLGKKRDLVEKLIQVIKREF